MVGTLVIFCAQVMIYLVLYITLNTYVKLEMAEEKELPTELTGLKIDLEKIVIITSNQHRYLKTWDSQISFLFSILMMYENASDMDLKQLDWLNFKYRWNITITEAILESDKKEPLKWWTKTSCTKYRNPLVSIFAAFIWDQFELSDFCMNHWKKSWSKIEN